jgi:hypothetical protein
MEIQTTFGIWYIVEVNGETHYVPPGCTSLDIQPGETLTLDALQTKLREEKGHSPEEAHELSELQWDSYCGAVEDYIDASLADPADLDSIEARECWGAQYHMPGYMDQTDWVLGDTEEEAVKECKELYGDEDDDMDDQDDLESDEDVADPVYPGESGCEFLREWVNTDFRLLLWDTNRTAFGGKSRLAYQFFHKGVLIFQGADYGCSPQHAVDSDECLAGLLSFLALRPGDVEREYFKDYSVQQMAFAQSYGEELGYIAMEMEEKTKDLPF